MNLQKMMKQAQQMQTRMAEVQQELEAREVDGSAGGGMVKVTINGKGQVLKLDVDKSLIDPEDKEMLEDTVIAAFNDAKAKLDDAVNSEMKKVTGGMSLPPGMKLPF